MTIGRIVRDPFELAWMHGQRRAAQRARARAHRMERETGVRHRVRETRVSIAEWKFTRLDVQRRFLFVLWETVASYDSEDGSLIWEEGQE